MVGHLKETIKRLLLERQYDELARLASGDIKILSVLISLAYDKKNLLCWRAIEAIGLITKKLSKTRLEAVRNLTGRLLWMIRDESGGIGWSSPEILGEIVRNNPESFSDIAPVIVTFHHEEMLRQGVLRAIGRIGRINDKFAEYAASCIIPYLDSPDPVLRGYTAWALGEIGTAESLEKIEELKNDNNLIAIYEDGELKQKTIGEIAEEAIKRLVRKTTF
ncbi:MAG: HEAT repeat domain-containing protein [Nitrospirae bacterium]|nr:HEAT repeat domain-containing protein [Nitrospirota bacterium]